jgi:Ti type entry exclusion protein TrbK
VVKVKAIRISIAALLAVGSAGVWFVISERQAAQERREKFFGPPKEYPTSGGQKMKLEW